MLWPCGAAQVAHKCNHKRGPCQSLAHCHTNPKNYQQNKTQMHGLLGNKTTTNQICVCLGGGVLLQATPKGFCHPSAPWHCAWHLAQPLAWPPLRKTWPTMCRCAPQRRCGSIKFWIQAPIQTDLDWGLGLQLQLGLKLGLGLAPIEFGFGFGFRFGFGLGFELNLNLNLNLGLTPEV